MHNLDEVITRSTNFGHLVAHEPLLAVDGAAAQSHVYPDPDTAMFLARRFVDTMTRKVAAVLGVGSHGASLYERIDELYRAGVLVPWVRQAFHYIRMTGSETVRGSRPGDPYTALTAVRDCFDLGMWLHNTITGGRVARAFVPPQAPESLRVGAPGREPNPLVMLLDAHQRRLAEAIGRAGAAGPLWIRSGALAEALSRMSAEEAAGAALRARRDELADRFAELAAGFDERLLLDRVIYGETLRANALRAGQVGKAELDQLAEIGRELRAAVEDNWRRGHLAAPVARARSRSFAVGAAHGGIVRQGGQGWQR